MGFCRSATPASEQAAARKALNEQQERERKLREKFEQPLPKYEKRPFPAPATCGCRQ